MAPPELVAALFVKLVVATVVASDSTPIPPPFEPVLFEKVDVPIDAVPEPMPPGEANAEVSRSNPPPLIPIDTLRVTVVPVTVSVPVPPICFGEEGV